MSRKVAVIGLDGMAWHIVNKLLKHGIMPNLKQVIDNSIHGILESTIPPLTPPAWTSIATGVNPGKHGVFDFIKLTNTLEPRLMSSHDVYYPRLHEMVALKGLKSVCINQPLTFPLARLKNTMVISDWIGPRVDFHPISLERFMNQYEPYTQEFEKSINDHQLLHLLNKNTTKRVDAVNQMMKSLDWSLFWVIYSEPDLLFHKYYENVLKGNQKAFEIFEKIDETIETAFQLSDLLIIISDHGFRKSEYSLYPNCVLNRLGLITKTREKVFKEVAEFHGNKRKGTPMNVKYSSPLNIPENIYTLLSMEPLRTISKKIYKVITGKNVQIKEYYVDPMNSKAFLMAEQGIFVRNEDHVGLIENGLRKIKGISQVMLKEKVYSGPYVEKAPHILFTYENGYVTGSAKVLGNIIRKRVTYTHHPDGIIIASTQGVKATKIGRINTNDVVPTILNYLGLPIPTDTDGIHIPEVPVKDVSPKSYNYLNHWRLIKKISTFKQKVV